MKFKIQFMKKNENIFRYENYQTLLYNVVFAKLFQLKKNQI